MTRQLVRQAQREQTRSAKRTYYHCQTRLQKARLAAHKQVWADFRASVGMAHASPDLFSDPTTIAKLDKTEVTVYGLALAQADESGHNQCHYSTPDCRKACVAKNGNGAFVGVQFARMVKVWFMRTHFESFRFLVAFEIRRAVHKHGGAVEFRLNTFSDRNWVREAPEWFKIPGAHFYDYTKAWNRVEVGSLTHKGADNYRLCLSVTETTTDRAIEAHLGGGGTVAMVLAVRGGYIPHTKQLRPIPTTWHGFPIIDGDLDDNRAKDAAGTIAGLRAKGRMVGLSMAPTGSGFNLYQGSSIIMGPKQTGPSMGPVHNALSDIVDIMTDGTFWDGSTLQEVADVLTHYGFAADDEEGFLSPTTA